MLTLRYDIQVKLYKILYREIKAKLRCIIHKV